MLRRIAALGVVGLGLGVPGALAAPQAPAAAGKPESFIVVMKADPAVGGGTGGATARSASPQPSDLKKAQDRVVAQAGVAADKKLNTYTTALNGFSVLATPAQADKMAKHPDVALVVPDELRQPAAAEAAPQWWGRGGGSEYAQNDNYLYQFLGLDGRGQAWEKGIDGSGVTVGVIDTGIWPEHPSFADDGSFPAHAPLPTKDAKGNDINPCAFGNTAHNPNDKPFTCNNKLVGARVFLNTYKQVKGGSLAKDEFDSARDNEGHGTHTASTSAGNAGIESQIFGVDKGLVSGIAPRAQVIAYKALGADGGYTSDLAAAIDQAVADGVGVINYSIGGGARVVSGDTLAFLNAAAKGVFAAVSAGNSGPSAKTIGGPSNVPWVTSVGANTQPTFYQGLIFAGGRFYRGASVTKGTWPGRFVDAANAGNELCLAGTLDPAKVQGGIVLCKRGGNGRVAKSAEVQRVGGAGMVLYNAVDEDTLFSDSFFVPTVMIDYTPGVAIKKWINSSRFPYGMLLNIGVGMSPVYSPTMAYFSSRGENPATPDIIKPDITAPGVQILAGQTPMPNPADAPQGELFQAIAGTSMSSPVVAGLYTLLKQKHPDWSPAAARSALMTTARTDVKDNDRKSAAGPFAMGAGMADIGKPEAKGTAFNPGLVYDASRLDYLGFLCDGGREAFGNPAATCAALTSMGYPTKATGLNLPSIGVASVPGTAKVTRKVTNVSGGPLTVKASVQAPAGYKVAVNPSTLTIAAGETASFEVTFTNTSGVVDQWRFGSLTWAGGGYSLRSPLAVKGSTVAADAKVTGSGASGTGSVAVQLGYNGPYTATAEGLVAATSTPGTVAQDPDQKYPSPDDAAGVVKIPFTLSGVGYARWALQLPGETDLDLYLLGPDGKQVALSGNGGTDELIELTAPADGTYTMVVHGWGVGATPVAFDLKSWLVPGTDPDAAPNLRITSGGSTTAVSGTTHTVGYAWGPLTTTGEHYGTITHRNDKGVIARTVVAVTAP